jgi:SAM-dependent methyltransferase
MIGWAPRDYARDHVTSWSDEVAAIELRSLMSEGYGVALLTQCTSPSADDRPAVRRAAGLLPEATVLPVAATLQEACAQWAKVDVLVGGRMHAAVGAIRTGAPALAVAYEEKVTGLFEDLGLGDWVIDSAEGLAGRIRSLGSVPRSLPTDWAAFDDQLRPPPPRRRPAIEFAVNLLSEELVRGREILEVGSWAGQGTARSAIEARGPRTYVGTDIAPGPGVDVVCRAEDLVSRFGQAAFDVVLATEVVEHIRDWRSAFRNIMGVLVPGGLLVVTTRSPGYPYHGSPHDYWRYNKLKMSEILMGWDIVALHDDPDRPGIFVAARKPEVVSVDLEQIALFSIAAGREQHQVSTRQIVLHRLSSPRRALAWLVPDWAKPILRRAARPFGYHTDYRGPSKLSQMKPRPKDDEPPA